MQLQAEENSKWLPILHNEPLFCLHTREFQGRPLQLGVQKGYHSNLSQLL